MGFMDKAKKMAEQAQHKLDDTQKQFNERQGKKQDDGQGVRYDEHGRPIEDAPPAATAPPPSAEPTPDPAAPPTGAEGGKQGSASPGSGPDPFKPIQ